jgi:N-acetylneuraminate synthase
MGKKLVASRDLAAGTVLTRSEILMKSPGDALFPYHLEDLLGRELAVDLVADQAFSFDHLVDRPNT